MSNILIVDDDFGIVNLLGHALRKEGYNVITFNSAYQALESVKFYPTKIDLIISDLKMPNIPGIDVIDEGMKKNIPAIIISGGIGTQTHIQDLKRLGYKIDDNDFVPKPLDLSRLMSLVRKKLPKENNK
jgi:DNA-binding NtrC family response regulator